MSLMRPLILKLNALDDVVERLLEPREVVLGRNEHIVVEPPGPKTVTSQSFSLLQ